MLFIKKRKVLLLGFGLIALYWLLDAANDTYLFREGDFVTELLSPGPNCLNMRLLTSFIIAGFSFITGEMLKRSASMKKEIELRERQQQAILNNIPDIAWLKDKDSRFIAVNESFGKACGFVPDDLTGKTDLDIWPPGLAERYRKDDREVVETGRRKRVEEPLEGKDGGKTWVETIKTPVHDEKGEVVGTAGIARDITGRKHVEEHLKLFSKAIEGALDGIQLIDLDGKIVYANRAAESIYGAQAGGLIGTNVNALFAGDGIPGNFVLRRIRELGFWNGEITATHISDAKFPAWLSATMAKNDRGEPIAIVGIIRDITERKLVEDQLRAYRENLEQSVRERTAELQTAINCLTEEIDSRIKTEETLKENQEKIRHMHGMKIIGEMAAAVAHEVRNPLHALMSVTEALQQELEGNADLDIYLRHIHEQVQRLSVLMRDLLDLGKPVEPSNLRRESLSEICASAIDIWKNLPLGREHDVKLEFPEDHAGIHVIADGQRLQQVFLNLLDNAAHHSEKGRGIDMIIDGPDLKKMVKIRVVDSGSGIPEEFLSKIFDPFFSTRRGGTGLGLNIVKNIIESHGGFLLLSNNTPLPGCTAEVNLPVAEGGSDETRYPSG